MPIAAIEISDRLDEDLLDQVLDLVEQVTRAGGHRPIGEHKYAQLEAGGGDWTGVLARDARGRLVGYAHLRWNRAGTGPRATVEYAVHPAAGTDAVATRLLDEAEALVARRGGGPLWSWQHGVADATGTLAARLGWRVQRELAVMTRRLDQRPPTGPPPAQVTVRAYRGEGDDAEFLRVNNAAFEGHPENGGWDRAEFAARRSRDWFDPEGLLMAWRAGVLVGFHWTKRHAPDSGEVAAGEPTGEVYVLAVDPAAHGLGLGRYLLTAGLAHLHDRGCRNAVLYVDTASPAALRLYASAGFEVAYREVCYERGVPPVDDRPRR